MTQQQVFAIVGSGRRGSMTAVVAAAYLSTVAERGYATRLWDLAAEPLPFADPRFHHAPQDHPDPQVRTFSTALKAADAIVLASPVYHSGYTGVLKNALDTVDELCFGGKPTALIGFGKNLTAVQVCNGLRDVVRGLRGAALSTQLVAQKELVHLSADRSTVEIEEGLAGRIELMAREMDQQLRFRRLHPETAEMYP